MDFTLKTYKQLLQTLKDAGYRFITFEEYVESRKLDVGSSFHPVASTGSATSSYRASSYPNRAEGELSEVTPHTPSPKIAFAVNKH